MTGTEQKTALDAAKNIREALQNLNELVAEASVSHDIVCKYDIKRGNDEGLTQFLKVYCYQAV